MSNTLKKVERLKSKKYFDALFSEGSSVKDFPIRTIFIPFNSPCFGAVDVPSHTQVAFSVPKKKFKHAVDRNRIKRKMREGYRLNKSIVSKPCAIIFVYLGKAEVSSHQLHEAMVSNLKKVEEKLIQ